MSADLFTRCMEAYKAQDFEALCAHARRIADARDRDANLALCVADMLHNLSCAASDRGLFDIAIACSGLATSLHSGTPQHWAQRMYAHLALERFGEAWDHRLYREKFLPAAPGYWDGVSDTPALFVFNRNGMGDFIQFMRFLPLARRRTSRLIVHAPPGSASLFRRSPLLENVEVITGSEHAHCTALCELMVLPFALGATRTDALMPAPYLHTDRDRLLPWKTLISSYGKRAVGLVWGGGAGRGRTLPFDALEPLFSVPGVHYFGLQSGPERDALFGRDLPSTFTDLGVYDLESLACICACMDVVIAPDVGMAHLSAALGTETWLALPRHAEWRWGPEGERSVWYPSMRLHRQADQGDWGPVVTRMRQRLESWPAGPAPR